MAERDRQTLERKILDISKILQIRVRLESDRHRLFPTERLIEKSDLIDRQKDIKQNIDLQRSVSAPGRYLTDNSERKE